MRHILYCGFQLPRKTTINLPQWPMKSSLVTGIKTSKSLVLDFFIFSLWAFPMKLSHIWCVLCYKQHSFSACLAKHSLALQLQLKGWIKEDLGFFFFPRVGGEKLFQRHLAIFSIPDFDISFIVCLISELDSKMPLVTDAVSVPETLKRVTSWSTEVSDWHAVRLSCQDPKWMPITIKCKLALHLLQQYIQNFFSCLRISRHKCHSRPL